jgi:hypothetical protein
MKRNHNQSPLITRRRLLAVGAAAAVATAAGVGLNEYNKAEQRRNAEIDRQVEARVAPVTRDLVQQVHGSREALQLDEHIDREAGLARYTRSVERSIGGNATEIVSLTVSMGLDSNGRPNPADGRGFELGRLSQGTGVDHHLTVSLAAPGVRVPIVRTEPHENWFAGYAGGQTEDPTVAYKDTEDRRAWAGNPHPDPVGVAQHAVDLAQHQLPSALEAFQQ